MKLSANIYGSSASTLRTSPAGPGAGAPAAGRELGAGSGAEATIMPVLGQLTNDMLSSRYAAFISKVLAAERAGTGWLGWLKKDCRPAGVLLLTSKPGWSCQGCRYSYSDTSQAVLKFAGPMHNRPRSGGTDPDLSQIYLKRSFRDLESG